eukprot:g15393.t1
MAFALLASPLAPSSTAFLTMTPTRYFQEQVTQQKQAGSTPSSRELCSQRRVHVHVTRLYGEPDTREDPAPTTAWTMPSLLTTAGGEAYPDSPAGGSSSLIEVTALAAVVLAIINLWPLDSASAAVATSSSAELVAQAGAVSVDVGAIFAKAGSRAFGGGISGAAAAVVQVLSLMWLRTTMNFQYKNGGSTQEALQTLWEEGGIPRLYRGVSFALVQGPLSRFGDTAANVGVLALLEAFESTRSLPLPVKSAAGSIAAGLWRIGLTPIDAYKTTLQVSGAEGTKLLTEKVAANGPTVLFEGALATATATFVGHYPWYFTYNALGAWLPPAPSGDPLLKLSRQAFLGVCSSCVSDCCSNSIRVVKTTKQTAPVPLSYPEALKQVVDEDGVPGLFLRGLQTRILVNALQGALFAVAWKYFQELFRSGGS